LIGSRRGQDLPVMAGKAKTDDGAPPQEGETEPSLFASRYEIQELLGRGSMGAVYCARDVVLDRPVAVKIFPTEAADAKQAVRIEQEARLLARLSHPGLVTVYDAGIDATVADEPRPYLVMELVRGATLADRLHDGPLPPDEVAALATQLSSALAHIHRREVVHRDVKPANILLREADDSRPYPTATLTDFGIARLIDGTRITMTGFTLGTANYLSPEQLSGGDVGAPSDIYSLGLVLLECLTGEVVYPGHGVAAAMPRLHAAPSIPDSIAPNWIELLMAMTNLEPARRPAAEEVTSYVGGFAATPDGDPTGAAATSDELTVAVPIAATNQSPIPTVDQTRVLPVVSDAPPGVGTAPTIGAAPGVGRSAPSRRRPRPALILGAVAALLVLIFVIAYLASGDSGAPVTPAPRYPNVTGPIGNHLEQLQKDVAQ
jgi:serine/threonine protein kinase